MTDFPLTVAQAASLIRAGELTPADLVEECLAQVEAFNTNLNAMLYLMRSSAREEAGYATDALQRGENWGPLHGIPLGLKDMIDVAGAPTTGGSDFFRDSIAEYDAPAVTDLRAAGAIFIGKTHLHELALGATNLNPHFGPVRNPWDTDRIAGGSSGGSAAAVASGMCLAALGTDTGGSVRVPAALCGLSGLRPGKGQISKQGIIPMSWTLDTVGPLARSAEDIALLADVLCNRSGHYTAALSEPVRGMSFAIPRDGFFWDETYAEIAIVVRSATNILEDRGMAPGEVSLPEAEAADRAARIISLSEVAAFHRERLAASPERFGEDVRARLQEGLKVLGADYAQARQTGRSWREGLRALFRSGVDVLVLPTTPLPAPLIEGGDSLREAGRLLKFTYLFSLSGMPCLSIPCGLTEEGLPVGMQLVAPQIETLLQVAHAYQQASGWHNLAPPLRHTPEESDGQPHPS